MKLNKLSLLSIIAISAAWADSGDFVWDFSTSDIVYSTPAIDNQGNIYVGSQDGFLYALNPNGEILWVFDGASDWIDSSPTVSNDGLIYAGSWDNHLYAVNKATGTLVWSYQTESLIIASPSILTDGSICFGSYDANLYCLNPDGSEKWISPLNGAIESSVAISSSGDLYIADVNGYAYSLDSETGAILWEFNILDIYTPNTTDDAYGFYSSPALSEKGILYIGNQNGNLYALDATLPNTASPSQRIFWNFAAEEAVDSSPVIDSEGNVIFCSRDGYLYKLDSDGFILWELLIGDVFYSTPAIDLENNIVAIGYSGTETIGESTVPKSTLYKIDPGGSVIWSTEFTGFNDSSPSISPSGDIYFGNHDSLLLKIEAESRLAFTSWPCAFGSRINSGRVDESLNLQFIDFFPNTISLNQAQSITPFNEILDLENFPWVYSFKIGWIDCRLVTDENEIWLFNHATGWMKTFPDLNSIYFHPVLESWLEFSSKLDGTLNFTNLGTGNLINFELEN